MNEPLEPTDQTSPLSSDEALGMSRFSIRRYSTQHEILLLAVNFLPIAGLGASIAAGQPLSIVLSATALACVMAIDALVLGTSPRVVQVEIWTRRLGMAWSDAMAPAFRTADSSVPIVIPVSLPGS